MTDDTEKAEGIERISARIYQFPLRGRMVNRDLGRADATGHHLAAVSGDSWYHQAAIDEDKH